MTTLALLAQAPAPPAPPAPPDPLFDQVLIQGGGALDTIAPFVVAVIALIVGGVLLYPIVRALSARFGAGRISDEVRDELDDLHRRVAELEQVEARLHELENRVEFSERLLVRERQQLPGEAGP